MDERINFIMTVIITKDLVTKYLKAIKVIDDYEFTDEEEVDVVSVLPIVGIHQDIAVLTKSLEYLVIPLIELQRFNDK